MLKNKEYTIDDFRPAMYAQVISAKSQSLDTINYSSILTKLIQEAGRWCLYYASDLFIDWSRIMREMEEGTLTTGSRLFGFREYGVDHDTFVFSRYSQNSIGARYEYRAIWRLDVDVSEEGIEMKLYEVSR